MMSRVEINWCWIKTVLESPSFNNSYTYTINEIPENLLGVRFQVRTLKIYSQCHSATGNLKFKTNVE